MKFHEFPTLLYTLYSQIAVGVIFMKPSLMNVPDESQFFPTKVIMQTNPQLLPYSISVTRSDNVSNPRSVH